MLLNKIKDIEEKRLQVAYFMSRNKGDVSKFSISKIYRIWCQWWSRDFTFEGEKLGIFRDEIVLSSTAAKSVKQPKCCDYYTNILTKTKEIIEREYQSKLSGRENSDIFRDKLIACRRNHGKALRKKLKKNGLSDRYYISHNSYTRYICKLGRYILHDKLESKDKYCYIGTYDEMRLYIDENLIQTRI